MRSSYSRMNGASRIALGYAAVSVVWILFSDTIVHALWPDVQMAYELSVAKGLAFIAVTAGALYLLIMRIGVAETQRNRALFERHPAPMLLIEPGQGRIVDANPAASAFYGWSHERMQGMRIDEINTLSPEETRAEMQQVADGRRSDFHFRHRLASGEIRDVEVHAGLVRIGEQELLYSIVHDETERKRAAALLQRQQQLYAAISEVNEAILRMPDAGRIYEQVCRIAVERTSLLFAWVGEQQADSPALRPVALHGEDAGYVSALRLSASAASPGGLGPSGRAMRSGLAVVNNDFLGNPDLALWHAAARKAGVQSSAAFPIRLGGRTVATLNVYAPVAGYFDVELVELFERLALDVSFALENDERRSKANAAAAALAIAEERWRYALEGGGHAVWEWNAQTDVTFYSPLWKAMLGYADDEVANTYEEWRSRVHPEDLEATLRMLEAHLSGASPEYVCEYRMRRKDGGYCWILDRGKVVSRDAAGRPLMLMGTHTNISGRKHAEQLTRSLSEQLQFYLSISPIITYAITFEDGAAKTLWVSENATRLLGYTREEMQEPGWWTQHVHPDDRDRAAAAFTHLPGSGGLRQEYRFLRKDGSELWVLDSLELMRDDHGQATRAVGAWADVSERRAAQDSLRQSEERFRILAEHSLVGIFSLRGDVVDYVNPRIEEIFGYAPDEMLGRPLTEFIAARDLPRVRRELESLLAGIEPSLKSEFAVLRKDGGELMVGTHSGRTLLGGEVRVIGMLQDITEKLRSEATIRDYIARMEDALTDTVDAMSTMVELRDPYTAGHERRVAELSAAIAAEMGLDEGVQRGLRIAGAVHDIGKIAVPSEILVKPGRLSDIELKLVRTHAEQGYDILKNIHFPWPVAEIARQHHERMDGSGYPRGLKGEEILLEARITAIADVVESMASHRPYRATLGVPAALEEIEKNAGRLYDPVAAAACLRLFREKDYRIAVETERLGG